MFPLLSLILTFSAFGQEVFTVKSSALAMKIPYSMGTHKAKSDKLSGSLLWDPEGKAILSGELTLLAENLEVKDQKLKCHLLESLTLDYEKSDFPADHVCEDDKLPVTGKNSPAYPSISATLLAPVKNGASAQIEWKIHGKIHTELIPLEITHNEEQKILSVRAKWKLRRSDYGIIVKKFLFIDADDEIPLELTIDLEKK